VWTAPWCCLTSAQFAVVFFFFSSRRRHTRCYRDWSSDVCSSDLRWPATRWTRWEASAAPRLARAWLAGAARSVGSVPRREALWRSEERRVGEGGGWGRGGGYGGREEVGVRRGWRRRSRDACWRGG